MLYLKKVHHIIFTGDGDENQIELEVDGEVKRLPNDESENVVFVGVMGSGTYFIVGKITFYDYVPAERAAAGRSFTRLTFKGTCITVSGLREG